MAVEILNRREQESGGSKGAKGHLEQHKRWSKLYGWVERKKGDHPCFSTPEASCRLLRDPGISWISPWGGSERSIRSKKEPE